MHGTSVGGAQPKALLSARERGQPARHVIAKFSLTSDPYPVVKAEAVAMSLARRVGLNVAGTVVRRCLRVGLWRRFRLRAELR